MPPLFVQVEPVADEELVRHDEADVAHRQVVDEPAVGAVEQRHRGDRARVPQVERPRQRVKRQPGVDDVLDEQQVAAGIVAGDVGAELADAGLQFLGCEKDLAYTRVGDYDARSSR